MNGIKPRIGHPGRCSGFPRPQRARTGVSCTLRVKSEYSSPEKYLAGQTRIVSGGSPASVQPRDSTFTHVPAKEMEHHGRHIHRANSSTRTRSDVSLGDPIHEDDLGQQYAEAVIKQVIAANLAAMLTDHAALHNSGDGGATPSFRHKPASEPLRSTMTSLSYDRFIWTFAVSPWIDTSKLIVSPS